MNAHLANNFTPLRLTLALLVVLGHFQLLDGVASPPFPFNYASFAVDGFFVVSGYLVTSSFDRDPDLMRFYVRRLFRIYPLYLLVVLAQTALLGALSPAPEPLSLLRYFAVNAVFANFLQYDIAAPVLTGLHTPGLNPSLWTLKIEIGFYLLLPFLWMAVRRFGAGVLVAVFAASVAYMAVLRAGGQFELAKQLPGQLQFFVLGIAAFRYRDRVRVGPRAALAAAIVLAAAATLLLPTHPPVLYPLVVGALMMLVALRVPPMAFQTDVSFGVYLLHAPLIQVALLFGVYRGDLVGLGVLLAVVIVLALMAERLVELPGIRIGRHLTRRKPQVTRAAG
ncbi:MAG: acyltransferase [Gemmatimonadaceae bacterium]|nr:acyltransferase [Acetobacteraceae bacterium]